MSLLKSSWRLSSWRRLVALPAWLKAARWSPRRPFLRPLALLVVMLLLTSSLLASCVPATNRASWRIFPLQRRQPHDGLAVVNQPDGFGVHLWLETDTRQRGVCRPRWLPDPPRLFNGNGSAPFSSGLATRQEFFEVVARGDVRRALQRELEALCQARAPRSRWEWTEPPRRADQVKQEGFPMLQEEDLLPDPSEVRAREEALEEGAGADAPAPSAAPEAEP